MTLPTGTENGVQSIWILSVAYFVACAIYKPLTKVSDQASDWSLRHVLPSADQFDIDRVNNGVQYQVTHLAAKQNSDMFLLLKQSAGFHRNPTREKPDFIFVVPFGEHKVYDSMSGRQSKPTYVYISKSGELGNGKDWCYVPKRFQKWMLWLKSTGITRHFKVSHSGGITIVEPLIPMH